MTESEKAAAALRRKESGKRRGRKSKKQKELEALQAAEAAALAAEADALAAEAEENAKENSLGISKEENGPAEEEVETIFTSSSSFGQQYEGHHRLMAHQSSVNIEDDEDPASSQHRFVDSKQRLLVLNVRRLSWRVLENLKYFKEKFPQILLELKHLQAC